MSTDPSLTKLEKKIHNAFQHEGLKITVEIQDDSVNYLDVVLSLKDKSYKLYKKPNNTPQYVNDKSNHLPGIIKNIPDMISKRLSSISSTEQHFNETKQDYKVALEVSGYTELLSFQSKQPTCRKRKRTRKILWFNPPYSSRAQAPKQTSDGNLSAF